MTITLTREEAQQVLDALEAEHSAIYGASQTVKAIETLRARLAQPEPEPVAWQSRMRPDWEENGWTQWKDCPKEQADNFWKVPHLHDWVYEARALYAAPPQRNSVIDKTMAKRIATQLGWQPKREWQGLTDEEVLADDVLRYHFGLNGGAGPVSKKGKVVIAAIEAKLKEKNYDKP